MKFKFDILFITLMMGVTFLPATAHSDTVTVQIIKSTFIPPVIKIKKGDTVRWVNKEELLHTLTSGKAPIHDDKFNASFLVKEFETTINEVGVIDYFCAIHTATMRGAIVVEEK